MSVETIFDSDNNRTYIKTKNPKYIIQAPYSTYDKSKVTLVTKHSKTSSKSVVLRFMYEYSNSEQASVKDPNDDFIKSSKQNITIKPLRIQSSRKIDEELYSRDGIVRMYPCTECMEGSNIQQGIAHKCLTHNYQIKSTLFNKFSSHIKLAEIINDLHSIMLDYMNTHVNINNEDNLTNLTHTTINHIRDHKINHNVNYDMNDNIDHCENYNTDKHENDLHCNDSINNMLFNSSINSVLFDSTITNSIYDIYLNINMCKYNKKRTTINILHYDRYAKKLSVGTTDKPSDMIGNISHVPVLKFEVNISTHNIPEMCIIIESTYIISRLVLKQHVLLHKYDPSVIQKYNISYNETTTNK